MDRFVVRDAIEVPKLGLKALRYQHKKFKLSHLHVQRPDRNKVFALAFKTNAPDQTGVPHILEHTTLCGSQKFPVRDPFFKMQNRSLANYMNALTGIDYTYYPFATTNQKDYSNLQQVYMDSVFSPLLRRQDFEQEGWRLEHENLEDKNSPLVFKGVVYNEMKGQMSMPAYYFYMSFLKAIYPSLNYSAGDPRFIPNLKYEDLVSFHHEKYHPDNCFTFSYGDFNPAEALAPIAEYLDLHTWESKGAGLRDEVEPIALNENVTVEVSGPMDPMYDANKQYKTSLTWFVAKNDNLVDTMAWRMLALLLADGHASPFYQKLIDSGLGPEFSTNTGLEEMPAMLMFSIGLQGISAENVPRFREVVRTTIEELATSGFAQQRIDAILHQAELSDLEVDAKFGMHMLGRAVSRAFHRRDDVMESIDNGKILEKLKTKLASDPVFFQRELEKLLRQPYFEFCMVPEPDFNARREESEKALLSERINALTAEQREAIYRQGQELAAAQMTPQNVDILPTVRSRDISPEAPKYAVQKLQVQGIPIMLRETTTQGISYLHLFKSLNGIPKDLYPYLRLYADALTNVGTDAHSMAELEDLMKLHTGGLSVDVSLRQMKTRPNLPVHMELGASISGLDSKLSEMYKLFLEVLKSPKLNNMNKMKAIIDSSASNVINSLTQAGHQYALSRASGAVSPKRAIQETIGGFGHIEALLNLAGLDEAQLVGQLNPIFEQIQSAPWRMRLGLTHSPGVKHKSYLENVVASLSGTPSDIVDDTVISMADLLPNRTHVPVPLQISHVGVAVQGAPSDDADGAALRILANLLTFKYLHPEIREKGGAYGGGASYSPLEGLLSFYSYRDPSPERTLDVLSRTGRWAADHNWTEKEVEEGKIGVFQSVDTPISPRSEISYELISGLSNGQRQQMREQLLAVTSQDLSRVAEKYLAPLEQLDSAGVCVIGPEGLNGVWTKLNFAQPA